MKVKAALKKMCDACFFVRRRRKLHVRCKKNPKHKQRQRYHTEAYPYSKESELPKLDTSTVSLLNFSRSMWQGTCNNCMGLREMYGNQF